VECICGKMWYRHKVPGLFVPKTFRSQERIVPMGNFRSRDFSFPGTFVPGERKFLELSFLGPFVPRNFRSQDFSFSGTFVPPTILQSISYEPQTAVASDRILCHRPIYYLFYKNKLLSCIANRSLAGYGRGLLVFFFIFCIFSSSSLLK